MKIKFGDKREIYNYCEPYVIAEIGSNHNGDMDLAKKMILVAKQSGADCVKFQSWSKETIFSRKVYEDNYFLKDDYRSRRDFTLEEIVDKYSITEQELIEMKRIADDVGIDCSSTPFSKREVDVVVSGINSPYIKVASMDVNNYPFLEYIARQGKPVVLSTGLSELYEIDKAIKTIENSGNRQIVILHCVSNYPPKDDDVNLNNIDTLQKLYQYPIGFSDHTLGFSVSLAAAAKGACIIEKHFTLDKNLFGWDHKVSALPDELKIICSESKKIHRALGSYTFKCEEDQERKTAFRRSIVSTRDIKTGERVNEEDIDYKRPGNGIPPEYRNFVIGRITKKNIRKDQMILQEDLV